MSITPQTSISNKNLTQYVALTKDKKKVQKQLVTAGTLLRHWFVASTDVHTASDVISLRLYRTVVFKYIVNHHCALTGVVTKIKSGDNYVKCFLFIRRCPPASFNGNRPV